MGLRLPCQSARSIASANISANTLSISAVEEEEEEEEEDLLEEEPIVCKEGREGGRIKGERHNSIYDIPPCFNFFLAPPTNHISIVRNPGHLPP